MVKAPNLKTSSVEEFASILDGTYFEIIFTELWNSPRSTKYPQNKQVKHGYRLVLSTSVGSAVKYAMNEIDKV